MLSNDLVIYRWHPPIKFKSTISDKYYTICEKAGWIEIPADTTLEELRKHWKCTLSEVPTNTMPKEMFKKEFKVPSSKGNKEYTITVGPRGALFCTCVGFGYRHHCRHVDDIKKTLGIIS